jgi:putative oxygen-independent coproporphyrinogen III oxidase
LVASIYVHFPYCLVKCPYCDFVSYKTALPDVPHEAYADAVLREASASTQEFSGRRVASIFFGGGTPSLWQSESLGRVVTGLRERFDVSHDAEITVECNPTSLTSEKMNALAQGGVNRLSVGVQSLQASELAYLGREHSEGEALETLRHALGSPVPRVSADLIFGLPEQAVAQGADNAEQLAQLGLSHISAYQLTIEAGTRFGELARAGRLPLADDGRVAEAFVMVSERLRGLGFRHYEISNYARPGQESRHNLAYWKGDEYLGLGCGAFGFIRAREPCGSGGIRRRNVTRPEAYLAGAAPDLVEPLSPEDLMKERIMLGLRLEEGFDIEAAATDLGVLPFPAERRRALDRLVQAGRVEAEAGRLRIPVRQWLFADDTSARLF